MLSSERGQIIVEYVLLMIIVVSLALFITSFMVSRNSDRPGFMISKWYSIIQVISEDLGDDVNPIQ